MRPPVTAPPAQTSVVMAGKMAACDVTPSVRPEETALHMGTAVLTPRGWAPQPRPCKPRHALSSLGGHGRASWWHRPTEGAHLLGSPQEKRRLDVGTRPCVRASRPPEGPRERQARGLGFQGGLGFSDLLQLLGAQLLPASLFTCVQSVFAGRPPCAEPLGPLPAITSQPPCVLRSPRSRQGGEHRVHSWWEPSGCPARAWKTGKEAGHLGGARLLPLDTQGVTPEQRGPAGTRPGPAPPCGRAVGPTLGRQAARGPQGILPRPCQECRGPGGHQWQTLAQQLSRALGGTQLGLPGLPALPALLVLHRPCVPGKPHSLVWRPAAFGVCI